MVGHKLLSYDLKQTHVIWSDTSPYQMIGKKTHVISLNTNSSQMIGIKLLSDDCKLTQVRWLKKKKSCQFIRYILMSHNRKQTYVRLFFLNHVQWSETNSCQMIRKNSYQIIGNKLMSEDFKNYVRWSETNSFQMIRKNSYQMIGSKLMSDDKNKTHVRWSETNSCPIIPNSYQMIGST